jgi:lipopolysaccharide export system permease protein
MFILTRYVLLETAKVFLISLTALTLMMIVIGVVQEGTDQHLPLKHMVGLVPYVLPVQLRITVPVTLLLACTTVFSRLSGANEVVAVKALGISPWKLLWPVFALSVVLSFATVWLNDLAVSWGRNGVQQVVMDAIEDIAYGMLESQHCYSTPFFSLNVKTVERKRLVRVTLTMSARGDSPAITITADEAELRYDRVGHVLKVFLRNGTIDFAGKGSMHFPNDEWEQEIPLNDASRARVGAKTPSWLPLWAIPEETVKQQALIERLDREMATLAAYQMLAGDFPDLANSGWADLASVRKQELGTLYRLMAEPHRRWSAGFSCLCFAWVGVPMAIRLRHRDFLTTFFLCFVPILLVYYPLLMYAAGGAKNGTMPAYFAWAGNLLLLAWGGWLLRRVMRY